MRPAETIACLDGFSGRGAGTRGAPLGDRQRLTGVSIGRLLGQERASQNVVSEAALNPDAGRSGLLCRDPVRRLAAWMARATGRLAPGWLWWMCLALAWLLVTVVLRAGSRGAALNNSGYCWLTG